MPPSTATSLFPSSRDAPRPLAFGAGVDPRALALSLFPGHLRFLPAPSLLGSGPPLPRALPPRVGETAAEALQAPTPAWLGRRGIQGPLPRPGGWPWQPSLRPSGRTPGADWLLLEPINMSDGRGWGGGLGPRWESSLLLVNATKLVQVLPPRIAFRLYCVAARLIRMKNTPQRAEGGRKHCTSSSF